MNLPLRESSCGPSLFGEDCIKAATRTGPIKLNASHATFAIALMSPRVFSTAAAAETSSRDRIEYTLSNLSAIRLKLAHLGYPEKEPLLDDLLNAHQSKRLVLRTYLTSAAGYRRHIAQSAACDQLKNLLIGLHLPHFNWVTEFSTIDSFNHSSAESRRVFGHSVVDATSANRGQEGLLLLHVPGLVFARDVNAPPEESDTLTIVKGDRLYEGRQKRLGQ